MRCYAYTCPRCGFTARVSGQEDIASNCFTTTVRCRDCRALHDVATHIRLPVPLALKDQSQAGTPKGRFPRKFQNSNLECAVPAHVWVGDTIIDSNPLLPPGLLINQTTVRWVQLALSCPVAAFHRIEPWNHPGRCPSCQTFLDRSLLPFRITD